MATPTTPHPAAYIAFNQSGSWLQTDANTAALNQTILGAVSNFPDYPNADGTSPAPDPAVDTAKPDSADKYGLVSSCSFEIERDYAGINSSGGPQVAGRGDYGFPVITRTIDRLSPILFESVWSGAVFRHVFLIFPNFSSNTVVMRCVMSGVNVTSYEFKAEKSPASIFNQEGLGTDSAYIAKGTTLAVKRSEIVRLNYTTIAFKWGNNNWYGWNTSTNNVVPVT